MLTRKRTLPDQTHWELAGLSIYNGLLRARQQLHPLMSLSFHSYSRTVTAAVQRLNRTPVHSSCIKDQFSVDSHNSSFIWTLNHRDVCGFVCRGHLSNSVERHQPGALKNKEGVCESQNVPVRACLWKTWPELKSQGQLCVWAPYQWEKPQQIWCVTGPECIDALNHSGKDLLSKNKAHTRDGLRRCHALETDPSKARHMPGKPARLRQIFRTNHSVKQYL